MSCTNQGDDQGWIATEAGFVKDLEGVKTYLFNLCLSRANGKQEFAEECFSETLLKLWKYYFTNFDGVNFGGWSRRVCINCCTNVWRKRKKRSDLEVLDMTKTSEDGYSYNAEHTCYTPEAYVLAEATPEEQLIAKETLRFMRRLIRQHNADPKRVALIIGCDLYDKTYQEMADMLEIPIGTVMSALFRARRDTREAFTEAGLTPQTLHL